VARTKTKTKEKTTLYTRIAEAAELEYSKEDYESPEDYKIELVEHFADIPEEDFDKLDEDIQTWLNEATKVWNANNKADEDDRETLPVIDGLTEPAVVADEDDDEAVDPSDPNETEEEEEEEEEEEKPVKSKKEKAKAETKTKTKRAKVEEEEEEEEEEKPKGKRGRPSSDAPKKKAKEVVKRDPDDNRFAAVIPHVMKDRKMTTDDVLEKVNGKGGKQYEKITIDRAMLAVRSVLDWCDRHGYEVRRAK
jgi:hypothetical protein